MRGSGDDWQCTLHSAATPERFLPMSRETAHVSLGLTDILISDILYGTSTSDAADISCYFVYGNL